MLFKASAPGSLMLLGEYAVLHGYPALVCAIDKRITVTLKPRHDQIICLQSSLGTLQTTCSNIQPVKPFEFVLTTLKKYQSHLQYGCDIMIEAEFKSTIGFASSAAVTVATLSAVLSWLDISYSLNDLLLSARDIVVSVQGMGSGADVAACIYGGIIAYQSEPLYVKQYSESYPITVIYSGSKTKTPEALRRVNETFAHKPHALSNIIQIIGECAHQGIQMLAEDNWSELGRVMNKQQIQMEALGVITPIIKRIMNDLEWGEAKSTLLGVKISGSGFGDCIIGLGHANHLSFSTKEAVIVPAQITKQGVHCEKI